LAIGALSLPANTLAEEALTVNPLVSLRDQMKTLNRECAGRLYDENCERMRKILRDKMIKLKEICRKDREDERCGSIMKVKKERGWRLNQFCNENPHSKKCVRRRERSKRREKIKRRFCAKNPDEKRCTSDARRAHAKRGYGGLALYCEHHKEEPRCKALAKKMAKGKPKPPPVSNSF
jgi:hypothetical protein